MAATWSRARAAVGLAVLLAGAAAACGGEAASSPVAGAATSTPSAPPLSELPSFDLPWSVAEAYAAIPHRRTELVIPRAGLSGEEAAYLRAMLHLIEQGVRIRVTGYADLAAHGRSAHDPVGKLEELERAIEAIIPPPDLAEYHRLIARAVDEQRTLFAAWQAAGTDFPDRDRLAANTHVRAASSALRQAWAIVDRRYRDVVGHDALFDPHCALDFL